VRAHEIIQIIHVVEGGGWVKVRGQTPVRLEADDTVLARPGEEHWHGAPAGRDAVHLLFTMGGHDWTDRSLGRLERDPV
jgi:quercetin dioxygenase-like cupin family protein